MAGMAALAGLSHAASTGQRCQTACSALHPRANVSQAQLPDQYWASQVAQVAPACYVRPADTRQVAHVVATALQFQCPFAINGGGHSPNPQANNLEGGITIDLAYMDQVSVSADNKTVSVGPGARWINVYQKLDPLGLAAIGGREGPVGVPGFLLGGGLSYLSSRHGMGLDNIQQFQVVLANGSVVEANSTNRHADLFKALRGGGNNFGIVTRFDLDLYPQGLFYDGSSSWRATPDASRELVHALAQYAHDASTDTAAHAYLAYGSSAGHFAWSAGLYYADPTPRPAVFAPFRTPTLEAAQLSAKDTLSNHSTLAMQLGASQPSGRRQQFNTATFRVDAPFMLGVVDIFRDELAKAQAQTTPADTPISSNMAFQPLPASALAQMRRRGGNALGLADAAEEPLLILNASWPWDDAADDAVYTRAMQSLMRRAVQLGHDMGVFHRYVYMNYATDADRVLASYGATSARFLQHVGAQYDPRRVFQELVPGGCKLEL